MRSDVSFLISVLRLHHCDPGWPGGPLRRHCRLQVRGEWDVYYLGHSESEHSDDDVRARVIQGGQEGAMGKAPIWLTPAGFRC